jgi:hypothetical protein
MIASGVRPTIGNQPTARSTGFELTSSAEAKSEAALSKSSLAPLKSPSRTSAGRDPTLRVPRRIYPARSQARLSPPQSPRGRIRERRGGSSDAGKLLLGRLLEVAADPTLRSFGRRQDAGSHAHTTQTLPPPARITSSRLRTRDQVLWASLHSFRRSGQPYVVSSKTPSGEKCEVP